MGILILDTMLEKPIAPIPTLPYVNVYLPNLIVTYAVKISTYTTISQRRLGPTPALGAVGLEAAVQSLALPRPTVAEINLRQNPGRKHQVRAKRLKSPSL